MGQLLAAIMGSQKQQIKRKPSSTIETAIAPAGIEANEKLNPVLLNEVEGMSEKGKKEESRHEDMRGKPSSKAEDSLAREKNDFDQGDEDRVSSFSG